MAGKDFENRGDGSAARWPLGPRAILAREQRRRVLAAHSEAEALRRAALWLAALRLCGEVGYERLTVEGIVAAAGSNRSRFYAAFSGKESCYAAGYEAVIEALVEAMLAAAGAEADWTSGFRAALGELAAFLAADEALARAVVVEVRVAGGAAAAKRAEVFERLSRAIDRARRENDSRHSPPPIAAAFILNGLESTVVRYLRDGRGEEFGAAIDELTGLAATFYPGVRDGRPRR